MNFKLQRANAVRDALDVIAQTMSEVVHRIDAPLRAGVMMRGVPDAIEQRIAHPDVRRGHIDLGPQGPRAVGKFPGLHAREQIEILGHAAMAERAFLGLTAILVRVVRREIADEGFALLDQRHGVFVNLVEVVAGVERLQWS